MQKGSSFRNGRKGEGWKSRTSELELDPARRQFKQRGGNGCWNGRTGQMSQKTKSREQRANGEDEKKGKVVRERLTNNWRLDNEVNDGGRERGQ